MKGLIYTDSNSLGFALILCCKSPQAPTSGKHLVEAGIWSMGAASGPIFLEDAGIRAVLEHVQSFTEWRCKQLHVANPVHVISSIPLCVSRRMLRLSWWDGKLAGLPPPKAAEHVTIRAELRRGWCQVSVAWYHVSDQASVGEVRDVQKDGSALNGMPGRVRFGGWRMPPLVGAVSLWQSLPIWQSCWQTSWW